jgi:hypothetical protein
MDGTGLHQLGLVPWGFDNGGVGIRGIPLVSEETWGNEGNEGTLEESVPPSLHRRQSWIVLHRAPSLLRRVFPSPFGPWLGLLQ